MTATDMPRDQQSSAALALFRAVRRRAWVVVLCAVAVPGIALLLSLVQHNEYSAKSSLLFRDPEFDQKLFGSVVVPSNTDPERDAATNVTLVSLDVVSSQVARAIGHGLTDADIRNGVSIKSEGKAN